MMSGFDLFDQSGMDPAFTCLKIIQYGRTRQRQTWAWKMMYVTFNEL
jgi:hypothetical protein